MSFQPPLFLNQWSEVGKISLQKPRRPMNCGWNQGNSFKWSRIIGWIIDDWKLSWRKFLGQAFRKLFVPYLWLPWVTLGLHSGGFQGACWIIWGCLNWLSEFLTKWWNYPFFLATVVFFKIPSMLGPGAISRNTPTWYVDSVVEVFEIEHSKQQELCLKETRLLMFFEARTGRFPKTLGECFFMVPHL